MIKQVQQLGLLCSTILMGMSAVALTPQSQPEVRQDYVFIENNIDKEYFIASYRIDPRFSGSNVWTKFKSNQRSLGYMGTGRLLQANSYVDYWIASGVINTPYRGQRCQINYKNCPSSGFLPPAYTDRFGVYKIRMLASADDGTYSRPTLSQGAYEYFKKQSVGTTENFYMNACTTTEEYSPSLGRYCRDASKGNWYVTGFNVTKMGHVTLTDTKAFQEVWYGTDGTPYLSSNATHCSIGVVGRDEGVICKMLNYNAKGNVSAYDSNFILYMVTDNAAFGFTPAATDLKINGGNGVWRNYTRSTASRLQNMMLPGDNSISVFFSNKFFQKLAKAKVNIRNMDNLFTLAVDNTGLPQSGYYQFSTSTKVELIPREYSVSIQPKGMAEGSTPVLTGKIGDSNPITFNYTVKQSAPRQADTIEAYVSAPNVVKNGQSYCSFKSADKKTEVAIPAWLSMQNYYNQEVKAYSGCDANQKLNMKNAYWSVVPWDNYGSGYFYSTNLKLLFPMDDSISNLTTDGQEWMGKVRAEGEIKVRAKWIGVTFP